MASEHSSAGRGNNTVLGKRQFADDSRLNDNERFVKRLNLLSLRDSTSNGSSIYVVPVPKPVLPSTANAPVNHDKHAHVSPDEHMHLDDTRDRVYIHNIDDELAEIEEEPEERLIFLPDIERHFTKIPQHVLNPHRNEGHENHEVVLYSVPKSLTVDEGHDSVRKAIIESRQRAREKATEEARMEDMNRRYEDSLEQEPVETAHGYNGDYMHDDEPDPDEMDMS